MYSVARRGQWPRGKRHRSWERGRQGPRYTGVLLGDAVTCRLSDGTREVGHERPPELSPWEAVDGTGLCRISLPVRRMTSSKLTANGPRGFRPFYPPLCRIPLDSRAKKPDTTNGDSA